MNYVQSEIKRIVLPEDPKPGEPPMPKLSLERVVNQATVSPNGRRNISVLPFGHIFHSVPPRNDQQFALTRHVVGEALSHLLHGVMLADASDQRSNIARPHAATRR